MLESTLVRVLDDLVGVSLWIPTAGLFETWQVEAGIDPALWTVTDPATGAAWARGTVGTRLAAASTPNANETARIRSNQPWQCNPGEYGINSIVKRLCLAFELQLTNVLNIDNTLSILGGFTAGGVATRATNNILCFGLVGDALQTITDLAGVETVNTGFGETLTDWNKLMIDITAGHVRFYLNETEIADHETNLLDLPVYLNWYLDTEAGGASAIRIGQVIAFMGVQL